VQEMAGLDPARARRGYVRAKGRTGDRLAVGVVADGERDPINF